MERMSLCRVRTPVAQPMVVKEAVSASSSLNFMGSVLLFAGTIAFRNEHETNDEVPCARKRLGDGQELRATLGADLLRSKGGEAVDLLPDARPERHRRFGRRAVGPAQGHRHDPDDPADNLTVAGEDAHLLGGVRPLLSRP